MDDVKMLEAQLELLQAEVGFLKKQKQQHSSDVTLQGPMKDALLHICCHRGGRQQEDDFLSRLEEEVEEMEEDLKQQILISGFSLNSCTINTVHREDGQLLQMLSVTGSCSQLNFRIECQQSVVNHSGAPVRVIDSLRVEVDDIVEQNFVKFLSSVEESKDILLFFKTLRAFSQRCNDQQKTLQHFQAKYPSIICIPQGHNSNVMRINHPQLSGSSLFVHWSVEVSKEGRVTPKIDLSTKMTKTASELFPCQPAEAFQSLLRIVGPEAALESLVKGFNISQEN